MPYFATTDKAALNSSIGRLASIIKKQNPRLPDNAVQALATKQALASTSERAARFAYQYKTDHQRSSIDPLRIDPKRMSAVGKRIAYGIDFKPADMKAIMASTAKQDVLEGASKSFRRADDIFGSDALARRVFRGYGRKDGFTPSDLGDYHTVNTSGESFLTPDTAKRLNNVRSFDTYKAAFDRIQSAEGGQQHFRNGLFEWYEIGGHDTIGHGIDGKWNKDIRENYPDGITPLQNDSLLVNRYLTQYDKDIRSELPRNAYVSKNPNQLGALMSGIHHRGKYGFFHAKNDMAGILSNTKAAPNTVAANWLKFPVDRRYRAGFINRATADGTLYKKPYKNPVFPIVD